MNKEDTGMVSFTLDPLNPPKLTAEQEARLNAMRDEDIDLSDLPDQGGRTDWTRHGRPLSEVIAQRIADRADRDDTAATTEDVVVRLQADVLSFFKESGDTSEDRINAALREYVETHRKSA